MLSQLFHCSYTALCSPPKPNLFPTLMYIQDTHKKLKTDKYVHIIFFHLILNYCKPISYKAAITITNYVVRIKEEFTCNWCKRVYSLS